MSHSTDYSQSLHESDIGETNVPHGLFCICKYSYALGLTAMHLSIPPDLRSPIVTVLFTADTTRNRIIQMSIS